MSTKNTLVLFEGIQNVVIEIAKHPVERFCSVANKF